MGLQWEAIVAALAIVGGIGVWGLKLESRVNVLEKVISEHLRDRQSWSEALNARLDRMERKIDLIRLRCVAFHHTPPPSLLDDKDREDHEDN